MSARTTVLRTLLVLFLALAGWPTRAEAQWVGLTNAFPSGFAEHCLLLTDGTVMCHEYNTNKWHRLKPDSNGSYQNGTWDAPGFTVANMPNANDPTIGCVNCAYRPLFFASQVLADGRVVVIGGEYNNLTLEVVRKLGLQFILWDVISGDPDPFLSAEKMRARVTASTRAGSVIVFHANGKGRHTREVIDTLTRDALPKRGLTPVTVTDLLACTQPVRP